MAAEALADLGARALSEVVAACRRLASWAHWVETLAIRSFGVCMPIRKPDFL